MRLIQLKYTVNSILSIFLLIGMLTTGLANTVTINSSPTSVMPGQNLVVSIYYTSVGQNEVVAIVNNPTGTWLSSAKKTVADGYGTTTLSVPQYSNWAEGENYSLEVQIRPVGSSYNDKLDFKTTTFDVVNGAPPNGVTIANSAPSVMPGENLSVSINYTSVGQNEVVAIVNNPTGTWLSSAKKTVADGSGTTTLSVPQYSNWAEDDNYSLEVLIRPVGSSYNDKLDFKTTTFDVVYVAPSNGVTIVYSAPSVMPGENLGVSINYTSVGQNEVVAIVNNPTGTWLSSAKKTVADGPGTTILSVPQYSNWAEGNNYSLEVQIRPVGSSYNDKLDFNTTTFNVSVSNNSGSQSCEDDPNVWEKSWVTCEKQISPNPIRGNSYWAQFEFDQKEAIENIHIWNANKISESGLGAKDIIIDYTEDGTTWNSLESFTIPQADESADYEGVSVTSMGGQFAKKILITIINNYNNQNCVSLSEIRFDIDETACYGIIDVCGICNGPGEIAWYADYDGDGLGDPLNSIVQCTQPANYVDNAEDQCDNGLYGWDVIGALFENSGCTGCHGTDGFSGLNLRKYDTMIQGGNKCGTNILTGTNLVSIITIPQFNGCSSQINGDPMNVRTDVALTQDELTKIQDWIDSGAPEFCACPSGSPDADNDGHCDEIDMCPDFDNDLIGTTCDDGLACTVNDRYNSSCNCEGTLSDDSDGDGVCDAIDAMPMNPCTADGVIGLPEPSAWIPGFNNDCDGDRISIGVGDLDDYDPCIDDEGYSPIPSCACPGQTMIGGGKYITSISAPNSPGLADGLPNGISTGFIGFQGQIVIEFPYLEVGELMCVTVGFTSSAGKIDFDVNGLGNYIFDNITGDATLAAQEYCFEVFQEGIQTVTVFDVGDGGFNMDGSSYRYCPCSIADPKYNTAACKCPNNSTTGNATYVSASGIGNPQNAGGAPDGIMTDDINNEDNLTLSIPNMEIGGEICVTVGMSDGASRINLDINGENFNSYNKTGIAGYAPQEICYTALTSGSQLIKINDIGPGNIRVDGLSYSYCNPCTSQSPDADSDGICDAYDSCPNTALNDSDNDGVCDDVDICLGSNDNVDSDGDGIPNGCDLCPGFDDEIDTDADGISNGCDICEGSDDGIDSDGDGIPDGCDNSPCLNFISELTYNLITDNRRAKINIQSNGTVMPTNQVTYKAGTSIILKELFEVKLSSTFVAEIEACN